MQMKLNKRYRFESPIEKGVIFFYEESGVLFYTFIQDGTRKEYKFECNVNQFKNWVASGFIKPLHNLKEVRKCIR